MAEQTETNLTDLVICACSRVWEGDNNLIASGLGLIQRLAASMAVIKNPSLMMTDSEAHIVSEPVPVGKRPEGFHPPWETWMGFSRVFENLWGGGRHALVGPVQVDQYGQTNISAIGDYAKPTVQMLGMRGYPGNSISHTNSFFVPAHTKRAFVAGEVDTLCSIGYNPARLPKGYQYEDIDIRQIVTNLCVMDFAPDTKAIRLLSLHPKVPLADVIENTGFELLVPEDVPVTQAPTAQEVEILAHLDPHNMRQGAL